MKKLGILYFDEESKNFMFFPEEELLVAADFGGLVAKTLDGIAGQLNNILYPLNTKFIEALPSVPSKESA